MSEGVARPRRGTTRRLGLVCLFVSGLLVMALPVALPYLVIGAFLVVLLGMPTGSCVMIWYAQNAWNKRRNIPTPRGTLAAAAAILFLLMVLFLYLALFYTGDFSSAVGWALDTAPSTYPLLFPPGAALVGISVFYLANGRARLKLPHAKAARDLTSPARPISQTPSIRLLPLKPEFHPGDLVTYRGQLRRVKRAMEGSEGWLYELE